MDFFQQAFKGQNQWYWWLVSLIIIFLGWQFIGVLPITLVALSKVSDLGAFAEAAESNFANIGIDKNLYLFVIITMFIFGLIGLFIAVKYIHKRAFKSIITSRKSIDWKRVFYAFTIWALMVVVATFIGILIEPENYTFNFNAVPFFTLVAISFLFLPFQTSFEELLFRGYYMQGLGILVKNRWFPLLVTSAVFGLLHGANPEVQKLGAITMVFYIGTGLFYGIVTLMDEGLELALGLHAANNIFAAFLVTTNWTVFQTDALYMDTSEPSVTIEMFLPVFVLYPLLIFIFSKKYNWQNWQEKLMGRIVEPILITDNQQDTVDE